MDMSIVITEFLLDSTETAIPKNKRIVMLGDFNINLLKLNTSNVSELLRCTMPHPVKI